MMIHSAVGVILAGGLSNRMGGGDKALCKLANKPILQHVIERLQPQVDHLIINANGNASRFSDFNFPVIPDAVGDYVGPLAGILAGLEWINQHKPATSWLVSASADTPFLPPDLVARLSESVQKTNAPLAVVRSQGFCHPVIGLWSVSLAPALRRALTEEQLYKVARFTARYPLGIVDYVHTPIDPFFNINTPEDLAQAERLLNIDTS
jgi:molybdopterin-guanine dinucleotide biosynthesis protein A